MPRVGGGISGVSIKLIRKRNFMTEPLIVFISLIDRVTKGILKAIIGGNKSSSFAL